MVDTGFSLEEDPATDYGSRPGRNQLTVEALAVADEVVVVGTADPVGLSRLARGLVELRETVGQVPTRLVVNRMRPTLGWSEQDVGVDGRGVRPAGRPALPARGPGGGRPGAGHRPDADRVRARLALVRALSEVADAVAPGSAASPPGAVGSGREEQKQPAHGEGDHRHQQRELTGELVLLRQQPDRPLVRGDHGDHVARDDRRSP